MARWANATSAAFLPSLIQTKRRGELRWNGDSPYYLFFYHELESGQNRSCQSAGRRPKTRALVSSTRGVSLLRGLFLPANHDFEAEGGRQFAGTVQAKARLPLQNPGQLGLADAGLLAQGVPGSGTLPHGIPN